MKHAGADRVVVPATIGAVQIADLRIRPAVVDLINTARTDNLRARSIRYRGASS